MDPNNKVEGVQFETDSYKAVKFYNETDSPKVVRLIMKYSGGAIKNEKQAEYVLLGFVALTFLVTIVIIYFVFHTATVSVKAQFREDISPEVRANLPVGVYETIPSKYENH